MPSAEYIAYSYHKLPPLSDALHDAIVAAGLTVIPMKQVKQQRHDIEEICQ